MALVVEDGSIVAGAESYLSVTDADTYWTEHGSPTAWTGATTAGKEAALRYATQWIDDNFSWTGLIVSSAQVLDWPRQSVYDDQGRLVADTIIPQKLKDATAEMAKNNIDSALAATQARGGDVKSEKVDVIEIVYMDWASPGVDYPYVEDMLRGYTGSGQASMMPIVRVA